MNIPVTGAFHAQPEHISYGMGLGRFGRPVAWLVYRWFKFSFLIKLNTFIVQLSLLRMNLKDKTIKEYYSCNN